MAEWGPAYLKAVQDHDWSAAAKICRMRLDDEPPHAEQVSLHIRLARALRQMGNLAGERAALRRAVRAAPALSAVLPWSQVADTVTCLERAGENRLAFRSLGPKPPDSAAATHAAMIERLRAASRNQSRFASSGWRLMGIGQDCIGADVAARWGLGRLVVHGPFTAGIFFQHGSALAVEDGLAGFTDASYHKLTRTPSGFDALTIPKYRAYLNHEVGPYWINGSSDKIIEHYTTRVAAFRNALRAWPVLFVFSQTADADPERLARALDDFSPGARFRILVVDYSEDSAYTRGFADARITSVASPKPGADYAWHLASCFNTAAGLAFERPIADSIAALLDRCDA